MTPERQLHYFGTALDSAGHYFWILTEDGMRDRGLSGFKDFPFDPERIANSDPKKPYSSTMMKKGDVKFFNIAGYSICYLEGSPADDRWGSKCVWWMKDVDYETLKQNILTNRSSLKIVNKLKFKINWP